MARINNNPLLNGISGKLGGLIFRQVNNQTIVSAAEAKGTRKVNSPEQLKQQSKLALAARYANAQINDPATYALYATGITGRLTSAYTVAVADFLNAPVITAVDLSGYQGQPGTHLRIQATDDFAVVAVRLRLSTPDATLLAEIEAQPQPDGRWLATCQVPYAPGNHLEVFAFDRPGNQARHTLTL